MNQTLPTRTSVVVVGAGPVGLAVAAQLGEMGIDVLVLERNAQSMNIPRAIVLDDEGMRTLQVTQVVERLLPLLIEGEGPIFYDGNDNVMARVGAGPREFGFSKRYFIHQPDLEEVLKQRLGEYPCVALHFNAEVRSVQNGADAVVVQVSSHGEVHTLTASVVLACDGARSGVREQLGIEMLGSTYDDDWLVIDTLNDPDQSRNSKAFCHLDRPYMSIPAPRGGRRYEFKLLSGETREQMIQPDCVQRLMQPIRTLKTSDVLRAAVYTFQARIAERLSAGRILLLGDAAHLTPPFAGQGMNAGLRDTANVAWKVAMVVRGQAPVSLLASYDTERRGPIWSMIQLAVTMGEIIMPSTSHEGELRAALLAKLDEFPGGKEFLIGMKFKPRPRYEDGVLLQPTDQGVPGSLIGCMIPQPLLKAQDRTQRLDDLIGPRFALLTQTATTARYVDTHRELLWPELNPAHVAMATTAEPSHAGATVVDPQNAFPLLAHRDQILLVRPDRYVAAAFWPEQAAPVVARFRERLARS